MKNLFKSLMAATLIMLATVTNAQHYIGYHRGDIMCLFGYTPEVQGVKMNLHTHNGLSYNILEYNFSDKSLYYYINPVNNICESFSAIYANYAVKDSLIHLFDSLYTRIDYPNDSSAVAWIEYEDGINYERVMRESSPPTCLIILAVTQKVIH